MMTRLFVLTLTSMVIVSANMVVSGEERTIPPYYKDLRHHYQYDKKLPLNINKVADEDNSNSISFNFISHDGEIVYGSLQLPLDYTPGKKYPVLIGDPSIVGNDYLNKHNFIVTQISLRLQGKMSREGLSNSDGASPFATIWARKNSVIDHRRLIDMLELGYAIDPATVIFAGRSRWGRIAIITAATDERITGVIAVSTTADMLMTVKMTAYETFRKTVDQPWFDEDFYRRIMAPIDSMYFADYVNVPVLVLHGEGDRIASIKQAELLVHLLGSNAQFISYPVSEEATQGLFESHHVTQEQSLQDVSNWMDILLK